MKPSAFFLIIFFFLRLSCLGQQNIDSSLLHDDSVLKKTYLTQVKSKKEEIIASYKGNSNAKEYKKIYEDHFQSIEKFVQGNASVTDPAVNNYLQQVVKKITESNPELKNLTVRAIFSRAWWPNAYSMGDGTIAFNIGLVPYLDNESEMAFVLAHELSHFYLKHMEQGINKMVETENSKEFQDKLKELSKLEYAKNQELMKLNKSVLFSDRTHSREYEAEADRFAYRFLKNTGFDLNGMRTCLELLDKIDDSLLFKPLEVDKFFDFPDYPFKKKWIQKESAIFSQLKEDDSPVTQKEKDSLKTHPDCSKRILLLTDSINKVPVAGRKKFIVDETLFQQLKKSFFIEQTAYCNRINYLSKCLYFSMALLQSDKENRFAVYTVTNCLNKLYESQKNHTLGNKIDTEDRYNSADLNSLLRMLNKIRLDEIASINYNFCKKYSALMKDYKGFEEEMKKAELNSH